MWMRRGRPTPSGSPTSRSPMRPGGTNPAQGSCPSPGGSLTSPVAATTGGSGWSTSPPPTNPPPSHLRGCLRTSAGATSREGLEEMTYVAFIGLGIMGSPMAVHLQNAGYHVTGRNRSPKYDDLLAAGGKSSDSVADAVADADVIAIMVPDSPDVAGVLRDEEDGVFAHAKAGALIIDFSSIRPDVAVELAAEARDKGFRMLDAPVSGGEPGAINAALSIMVGGDAADFDEAKPIFDTVGKTIVHVGPAGSGQTVKAANQLIVATNIQALSEAVIFL